MAVWELGVLKALDGDARPLVELPCYLSRERVNLHAVEPAVRHAVWKQAQEVAHAAGRLQDVAFGKAKAVKGFVHRLDDNGRGIERRQGGFHRRTVFLIGEDGFQLLILVRPCRIAAVKRHRQTAPSHILGKGFLFFGRGKAVLNLQFVQEIDRRHVVSEFLFGRKACVRPRRINGKGIVRDAVVAAFSGKGRGFRRGRGGGFGISFFGW